MTSGCYAVVAYLSGPLAELARQEVNRSRALFLKEAAVDDSDDEKKRAAALASERGSLRDLRNPNIT